MGLLVPLARGTRIVPRLEHLPPRAPHQLDLVLDDMHLRGMTPAERQSVIRSLARLMLESRGLVMQEASDELE
jgi:hypothetical protein